MEQQPLRQRIVFSKELAHLIKHGRVETKLHINRASNVLQLIIKPRSYAVPKDMPVKPIFTPAGLFSGWFAVQDNWRNTYTIVTEQSEHAYPLYLCSSGNPQCTAVVFSGTSCCDACAAQL